MGIEGGRTSGNRGREGGVSGNRGREGGVSGNRGEGGEAGTEGRREEITSDLFFPPELQYRVVLFHPVTLCGCLEPSQLKVDCQDRRLLPIC